MKLWCLFLVLFLLFISSTSSWYLNEYNDALISSDNSEIDSRDTYEFDQDRYQRSTIVKRSQRNANILYRYCRRNGQARHFCLRYAVTMLYATGH